MINSLPVERHEDSRRTLIEWVKDFPLRSCKVVIAKTGQKLGEHHHNEKDEIFYLLRGNGIFTQDGKSEDFKEGDVVYVPKGSRHAFSLSEGAIMLGAATKPFNEHDEIK